MKIETLAKRIAEKTDSPVMGDVILGSAVPQDLPTECVLWAGATTGKRALRQRVRRDYGNLAYPGFEFDRPRAVVNFEKKRHYVNRLLFEKLASPGFPYRLEPLCGQDLCVNPLHFHPKEIRPGGYETFSEVEAPPEDFSMDDPWTIEEAAEIIEMALTEHSPTTWFDLMKLPCMEDVPKTMVSEYLASINKQHLLPLT